MNKSINDLKPIFEDYVTIVTSCSDEYVPYLLTCFTSLKEHSNKEHNYDIIVCENGVSETNQNIIRDYLNEDNFSVRFLHIDSKTFPIDVKEFCKGKHFSQETFFRILIPGLIPNYSKIIYVDIDILIMDDIYKLKEVDLEGNTIGACKDALLNGWIKYDKKMYQHLTKTLKLEILQNYFQAGIMIFDCDKYRKDNCERKLLELMKTIYMRNADQCILNKLFNKDVKILDMRWNYEKECSTHKREKWVDLMEDNIRQEYLQAKNNPAIIHYIGKEKPWFYNFDEHSHLWWQYAEKTPFYEEIKHSYKEFLDKNKPKIERKILKYSILSKLTFGKKKAHYKDKYKLNVEYLKKFLSSTFLIYIYIYIYYTVISV